MLNLGCACVFIRWLTAWLVLIVFTSLLLVGRNGDQVVFNHHLDPASLTTLVFAAVQFLVVPLVIVMLCKNDIAISFVKIIYWFSDPVSTCVLLSPILIATVLPKLWLPDANAINTAQRNATSSAVVWLMEKNTSILQVCPLWFSGQCTVDTGPLLNSLSVGAVRSWILCAQFSVLLPVVLRLIQIQWSMDLAIADRHPVSTSSDGDADHKLLNQFMFVLITVFWIVESLEVCLILDAAAFGREYIDIVQGSAIAAEVYIVLANAILHKAVDAFCKETAYSSLLQAIVVYMASFLVDLPILICRVRLFWFVDTTGRLEGSFFIWLIKDLAVIISCLIIGCVILIKRVCKKRCPCQSHCKIAELDCFREAYRSKMHVKEAFKSSHWVKFLCAFFTLFLVGALIGVALVINAFAR
ncbi:uncharacterized protein LOC106150548 [Lingula anatina]|uniref:Uncharacterized protein LOC106150548 n=2 Tax=Lingula anatina TaxID=7574 RepID=A0A1S3GYX2_LINAN|nr:uncharacterized protein LOC106150548 [Lingula anatina]|eukprot:XP_013378872.1 uncharacterized protein LOC106150548 [Lingula anatina]